MRAMTLCGAEVYATELDASGGANIRDVERACGEALVLHRYGEDVRLLHHSSGVPYVEYIGGDDGLSPLPAISLSHGGGWAVMAVAAQGETVGVDIEAPRSQLHRVVDKFLSESEKGRWDYTSLPVLQWLWTVKEAVYKAALTPGLPLKDIEVISRTLALVRPANVAYMIDSTPLLDCVITVARPENTENKSSGNQNVRVEC